MRYTRNFTVAILLMLGSGACASATHLTKEKQLKSGGSIILIDAKQRAITNAVVDGKLRICAEPSPDALSALAASGGISAAKGEALKLAANASFAEGAGSIGLRTQSIQLMRDAMYRQCEAYVSGAIDSLTFETMQRRFQSSMVAILAIEQLTGVVRPAALALGGTAKEGDVERAADLTDKTVQSQEALRKAESDLADKQDKLTKATSAREALEKEETDLKKKDMPTDADKKRLAELPALIKPTKDSEAAAKQAVADATKVKNDRESVYTKFDEARQAALSGGGSASVTATTATTNEQAQLGNAVAAVQAIVDSTLNLEFGRELCTTVLTKSTAATEPFDSCVKYLGETVAALKGQRTAMESFAPEILSLLKATTALINNPAADPAKVKAAVDALAALQRVFESGFLSTSTSLAPPRFMVQ